MHTVGITIYVQPPTFTNSAINTKKTELNTYKNKICSLLNDYRFSLSGSLATKVLLGTWDHEDTINIGLSEVDSTLFHNTQFIKIKYYQGV